MVWVGVGMLVGQLLWPLLEQQCFRVCSHGVIFNLNWFVFDQVNLVVIAVQEQVCSCSF